MLGAEAVLPADWFAHGDLDVQAAEILLAQGGPATPTPLPRTSCK